MADRTPPSPDVIPVREDEKVDEAKVADYLEGKLPKTGPGLQVWQFPGGHANLTYLLHYPGVAQYVLRRGPHGYIAASAHDMGREYRVLSVLWRAYPPAPRAFLYCEDRGIVGAPFFVMERRLGTVVRREVPPEFGGGEDPVANRKLSEVVVDALADFHAVDEVAAGLAELGKPDGYLKRQVSGWTQRWERAKTREMPAAPEVIAWLEAEMPPSPPPTLVHNDWRLDNMAVAPDDPGRCVAVYDWDMCTLGDPLCDLGTLLSMWSEPGEAPAGTKPMPSQVEGFLTRAAAAGRYAERSGRSLEALAYYVVFGTFKMAVVLQQIYFRYERGQTQDRRFAALGDAALGLFQLAAERRP